jgi:hypothetical protein
MSQDNVFAIVSHFHWLGEGFQLSVQFVHTNLLGFIVQAPEAYPISI